MWLSKKNDMNTSGPNVAFYSFSLELFSLQFFYWIGSVLNTLIDTSDVRIENFCIFAIKALFNKNRI